MTTATETFPSKERNNSQQVDGIARTAAVRRLFFYTQPDFHGNESSSLLPIIEVLPTLCLCTSPGKAFPVRGSAHLCLFHLVQLSSSLLFLAVFRCRPLLAPIFGGCWYCFFCYRRQPSSLALARRTLPICSFGCLFPLPFPSFATYG